MANMVEGGRSPVLPAATLARHGVRVAIYPATAFLAATAAMAAMYAQIKATGTSLPAPVPLTAMADMHKLMGFEDVWAFERKWAEV